jgi:glutamate synthase (NADPH/NADH) large chain
MTYQETLESERLRIAEVGMYRPELESDACGVGLVAATDGKPSRRVVVSAIDALKAVWHRGAVDADGKTGDGAGIHVDLPVRFFDDAIAASGHKPLPNRLAVGMVFLPRTDLGAQEMCRTIVEAEIIEAGYTIYGWRQVPVDVSVIGEKAQRHPPRDRADHDRRADARGATWPSSSGALSHPPPDREEGRRLADQRLLHLFAVVPLDHLQGHVPGREQVDDFYPDLRTTASRAAVAIFHQRYSTNTFPQWWLAQPFRTLAHNGEINTLRGNKNWMKSHEIKMASSLLAISRRRYKAGHPCGRHRTLPRWMPCSRHCAARAAMRRPPS